MHRSLFGDFCRIMHFRRFKNPRFNDLGNYSNFHTIAGKSFQNPLLKLTKIGLASAFAGSLGYFFYNPNSLSVFSPIPLPEVNEDSFDSKDDLVVVILDSKKRKTYPKQEVELLRSILPRGITLYYSIKKSQNDEGLRVMFYKGMRKKYYTSLNLSDSKVLKDLKDDLELFFRPRSQDVSFINEDKLPEYVSHNNFKSHVVDKASKDNPILLQTFEDTCFLCFLVRPFINSVNKHLIETNNPIRIKRLNIELNDFPKECPVTRATPTFVLYTGGSKGDKWEEFKPKEFIQKLFKVSKFDEKSRNYLEELSEKIPERFMLFGKLAMWLSESQKLQELMLKSHSQDFELTSDEDMYSRSINILMDIDMKRTDSLEENLENLKMEIESAEKDCIAVAEILAQEIILSEKAN